MRILWIISSLGAGGAERVTASICRELAASGHDLTVATLAAANAYALPDSVLRVSLEVSGQSRGLLQALGRNVTAVRALRKLVIRERPDVVVSFMSETNVVALLATAGRAPTVVSERIHPGEPRLSRAWRFLRWLVYPRAELLVVPSPSLVEEFAPLVRRRLPVAIANPVAHEFLAEPVPTDHGDRRTILAVGRLTAQKNYPLLITAFSRVAKAFPEFRLRIVGDGDERAALEDLVADLRLAERVEFAGTRDDMVQEYDRAAVLVLASRYEGSPNVLAEAMSRGVPVISTDCPTGPSDLVTDGVNGFLCPVGAVGAMAERLALLLSSASERRRLGESAREVRGRLAPGGIARRWEDELGAVCRQWASARRISLPAATIS